MCVALHVSVSNCVLCGEWIRLIRGMSSYRIWTESMHPGDMEKLSLQQTQPQSMQREDFCLTVWLLYSSWLNKQKPSERGFISLTSEELNFKKLLILFWFSLVSSSSQKVGKCMKNNKHILKNWKRKFTYSNILATNEFRKQGGILKWMLAT